MICPEDSPPATSTGLEWELLAASARSAMSPADSARIRALAPGRRLESFGRAGHRSPCGAALVQEPQFGLPGAVPHAALNQLERFFSANVARNLALTSELLDLITKLSALQIPAIAFKGPTLASLAYGGLWLRQAGDLDILIHRRDAIKAREMLLSLGFHSYRDRDDADEFARSHHFMMVRDERPLTVEIHWQLMDDRYYFNLSVERLWRHAHTTRLAGVDVRTMPTAELMIFLCAHGTKHCWQRLSWVCDIAELIRVEPEFDWDAVLTLSRKIGSARMLSLGVLLAHEILDAPLPEPIAGRIRADRMVRILAREVIARYRHDHDRPLDFADIWPFNLSAGASARDRLMCRLNFLTPALRPNKRDIAFVRLPQRLSFLYPAVKPVRLARNLAKSPVRSLRLLNHLMGFRHGTRAVLDRAPQH